MSNNSNLSQIQNPIVQVMTVSSIENVGTFLKTGQDKELLLPQSEQWGPLSPGDDVVVLIKTDKEQRPIATEKFEKILFNLKVQFTPGQAVNLIIYSETDLGYKAVINQQATGLLYKNEIFQTLHYGQHIQGFVKLQREDGKIDLILRAPGHKATEDIAIKIIEFLENNNGFYVLNDKTPSEKIYELFGVSKKKFKIALGGLYKKRLIRIEESGIFLIQLN